MQGRLGSKVFLLASLLVSWEARAQPVTGQVDLTAPAPSSGTFFGTDVAISADGNTALVGAAGGGACSGSSSLSCGAAYVFVRQGEGWSLDATLTEPEPGAVGFGKTVALSGDGTVALVAAPQSGCLIPLAPNTCGEVFAFVRAGGTWVFEKKIQKAFELEFDQFGLNMALSQDGSTAVIASPGDECIGGLHCGAGYVFDRAGGAWNQQAQLLTSPDPRALAGLSAAIAADGNTILLGAQSDQAFVFTRSGGAWTQTARIPSPAGGNDSFGSSVALSADGALALIGASGAFFAPLDGGAVYSFIRNGITWTQQQKVTVAGAAAGDHLGSEVALSGDGRAALVLASSESCTAGSRCGAVYEMLRQGGTWSAPVRLFALVPRPAEFPPPSLALSAAGRTGIAGAPAASCPAGTNCGFARVFDLANAILDVPTLGGPGLAVLTIALILSALFLLQRRRSI
jgi:hypothetical protein